MTKAEKEKLDDQHEREALVSRAKLVLIVLCVIAIPVTFWVNHHDVGSVSHRISRVESPCLKYGPRSLQCQRAFEAAVATITHPEACAVERKAGTLKALRELAQSLDVDFKEPCKGARLAQERQRGEERTATKRQMKNGPAAPPAAPEAGDATTSAPTGSSQPGRHEGGSGHTGGTHDGHEPGKGGSGGAPVSGEHGSGGEDLPPPPAASTSEGSTSTSATTTERTTETTVVETAPEAEAPVRTAAGGVVEALKPTVESLGETVGGTVEGVEATMCELGKVLCGE